MATFRVRIQHNRDHQWEEIVEVEADTPKEAARRAKRQVLDNLDRLTPTTSFYGEAVQVDEEGEDLGGTLESW